MSQLAKMTSISKKKTIPLLREIRELVHFLDQCVKEQFDGSYASLATASGVTEGQLSRIRSGKRALTAQYVGRLARALETRSGDQLIGLFAQASHAEATLHRVSSRRISKKHLFHKFR